MRIAAWLDVQTTLALQQLEERALEHGLPRRLGAI